MNYKHQKHFLNDVTMWRAHVPALINMDTIKSPIPSSMQASFQW